MQQRRRIFLTLLTTLLLAILIDYFNPVFFSTWLGGYIQIPFYAHAIYFIGSFFAVVLCHELAHTLAFLIKGIKPKLILVLMFVFYRSDRWHLKIDFKLLLLGGGIVMPEFNPLESKNDIDKYQKATTYSLLFAPIFTIVSASILLLLNVLFWYHVPSLTVVSLYVALFSAFFTYTSTLSAAGMFGDFVAYKKVTTDPVFGLSIVSQYVDDMTPFHYQIIKETLFRQPMYDFKLHLLNFYGVLLEKGIHTDTEMDSDLLEKTKTLVGQVYTVRQILRQQQMFVLVQMAIGYLYRCHEDELVTKLLTIFNSELESSKLSDAVKTYYQKQTSHLLGMTDESEYLATSNASKLGFIDQILSHMPEYQEDEKSRSQQIIRFEKKDTILLDNIESL